MNFYKSELRKYPHSRSLKAIRSLVSVRGVSAGLKYAEGFVLVRKIKNLMKIKINNKLSFNSEGRTLIIAEVSANHCGSNKNFCNISDLQKKMAQI